MSASGPRPPGGPPPEPGQVEVGRAEPGQVEVGPVDPVQRVDPAQREAGPGRPLPAGSAPEAELDLDLDAEPAALASGGRRPLSALAAVLLLGILAGAWGRSALGTPSPITRPQVSASTRLSGFTPADPLLAVLQVVVTNHDLVTHRIVEVAASGDGLAGSAIRPGVALPPDGSLTLQVSAPVHCPAAGGGTGADPLRVGVRLDGDTGPVVNAVAVGDGALPGHTCVALQADLPAGWQRQAGATVQLSATGATVRVHDLPADADAVGGVGADGWLVPMAEGPVPVRTRSATLELLPISPLCTDPGTRDVLPVGLQLQVLRTSGGLEQVYLPVGPQLAGWLLAGRRAACPGGG